VSRFAMSRRRGGARERPRHRHGAGRRWQRRRRGRASCRTAAIAIRWSRRRIASRSTRIGVMRARRRNDHAISQAAPTLASTAARLRRCPSPDHGVGRPGDRGGPPGACPRAARPLVRVDPLRRRARAPRPGGHRFQRHAVAFRAVRP
jgi:hypothetical protein